MMLWLKRYINLTINKYVNSTNIELMTLKGVIEAYRKDNQSLSGRIKILEEQHDIMHNFLVEINKYLVKLTEKDNGI